MNYITISYQDLFNATFFAVLLALSLFGARIVFQVWRQHVKLYRIEDSEGRGPYRPGMSKKWADTEGPPPPPTWGEEFGTSLLALKRPGENMQCGFRTETQLHRWFTNTELYRLQLLGYRIVQVEAERILAESRNQVVFIRRKHHE